MLSDESYKSESLFRFDENAQFSFCCKENSVLFYLILECNLELILLI